MIRAGTMRHRLIIQRPIETSDGTGAGGTTTWSDVVTMMAERWSVKGSERVEAARNKQNSIVRWHCRHTSAIEPQMRIKWIDRGVTHYQEIIAINQLGNKGNELEILAEEKT